VVVGGGQALRKLLVPAKLIMSVLDLVLDVNGRLQCGDARSGVMKGACCFDSGWGCATCKQASLSF
jgi:hypothetical protein